MHKNLLAALIVAGAGLSLNAQAAQTGQIQITGKVVDTTCSVDAASGNVQVTLPNVDKSLPQNPGSNTGITPFSVKVSGCTGSSGTGGQGACCAKGIIRSLQKNNYQRAGTPGQRCSACAQAHGYTGSPLY